MKTYSKTQPAKARREKVIKRLNVQLKVGKKNTKDDLVELSEKDISRIEKELDILSSRV